MTPSLTIRLDWSELDLFGHINNVAYFKYAQASRVHFWELIGMYQDFLKSNIGPIVASTGCNFIRPLFYPGSIRIDAQISFIKNSSFGIVHKMYNDENQLVAEVTDAIVYFNFHEHVSQPIPDQYREKLIPHYTPNNDA